MSSRCAFFRVASLFRLPILVSLVLTPWLLRAQQVATAAQCVDCHSKVTPNIVSD